MLTIYSLPKGPSSPGCSGALFYLHRYPFHFQWQHLGPQLVKYLPQSSSLHIIQRCKYSFHIRQQFTCTSFKLTCQIHCSQSGPLYMRATQAKFDGCFMEQHVHSTAITLNFQLHVTLIFHLSGILTSQSSTSIMFK